MKRSELVQVQRILVSAGEMALAQELGKGPGGHRDKMGKAMQKVLDGLPKPSAKTIGGKWHYFPAAKWGNRVSLQMLKRDRRPYNEFFRVWVNHESTDVETGKEAIRLVKKALE